MSVITIFVQSDNASSERRFDKGITISQLKNKLEPITGVSVGSQILQLYNGDTLVTTVEGDDFMLGAFPIDNYMTLKVIDTSPNSNKLKFNDLSQVEKYELPDDEYEKRTDEAKSTTSDSTYTYEEEAKSIKVGDRCEIDFGDGSEDGLKRRGTVRYVGETKFKPGYWVGVEYDEPVGKHDGTVQGEKYFNCSSKHGAFVRPNKVKVGDFPEENIDDEEM
ncbi:6910_t:CDS:2 [Entrophospora sp. SA101]|nr:8540_t:CDS:2 [Entrophospora sp. SA101]CAJ0638790.1 11395_t:CDS:2 [Entrophospora sp. SA101]CAJ0751700.1 9653_t:CDS:2 [Entrophospora sp. SA101]CAJ0756871.1 6910_t:CDS:2 [Entrophospora sp. SA101]CAJ0828890.1 7770_t:CDS:2 [Entrophospora sp. SA101]